MDKEMANRAEAIVDRHIRELMLQLENITLENDEYKGMVRALLEGNPIWIGPLSLKMQEKFIVEIGD